MIKLIAATLILGAATLAQQAPTTSPVGLQAEFRAAQEAVGEKSKALALAQSDFNMAVAQRDLAVYKLMAEAGVKPSECRAGDTAFACVKTDPVTGLLSFEKRAAPKPSPEQPKNK